MTTPSSPTPEMPGRPTLKHSSPGRKAALTAVLFCAAFLAGRAQTSLMPSSLSSYTFTGTGLATASVVTVTPPTGATFTQAWDVNVTANTSGHDVTLGVDTTAAVAVGDALVATVWYRRTDGLANEANIAMILDNTTTPFLRSTAISMRGRAQWRQLTIPLISAGAGTGHFYFEIGFTIQHVQIGGVQLLDYGQKSVLSASANVADGTSQFGLSNLGGTTWGAKSNVAVTGNAWFTTCDQVNVTTSPGVADAWECALTANLAKAVTSGDTLVAIFWASRDSTSNQSNMGITGFKLEDAVTPFTNVLNFSPMTVDGNWKQFYIPIKANASYPANGSQFQIWCGAAVQKLDIGGIQVIDLGPSVALSSLTNNELDYPGRGLNDSWQAPALTRIQQLRMGNLSVNVQNASGAALSGVTVAAAQQKHQFGFGTVGNWAYFLGNPGGGQAAIPNYQNALNQYSGQAIFNKFNMSDYKWPAWEQSGNPAILSNTQTWIRGHGITNIHAHNLVWPNYRTDVNGNYIDVPPDVPTLSGTTLANRVLTHLDNEVPNTAVKSLVDDWDVVNEPWDSRSIQCSVSGVAIGHDTVAQDATVIGSWFTRTATDDPAPNLLVNDSGIENNSAHIDLTEENYDYSLLTTLISDAAPVDGLGFESHFGATVTPPDTAKQIFDRFAGIITTAGHPLMEEVTEYDTQITDPVLEADYLADYMTMAFSEPDFDQFSLWGFWAGDFPDCALYDSNWNQTLMGEVWKGLVYNKWWTNASVASNTSGVSTINGFLGRYALTATSGGITKTFYADLPTTAGASVNLKLGGTTGTHVWLYEAENAENITAPFGVGTDTNALNGAYLTSPLGTNYSNPPTTPQARINIEATGNVTIWVRVIAPNPNADSFFAQIDNNAWQTLSLPDGTAWHWYKWTTATLAAGTAHVLNLGCRETTAELDQVLVTDDPNFTP